MKVGLEKIAEVNMTWWGWILIGTIVGGGGTAGTFMALNRRPDIVPVVIVPDNKVAEEQIAVQKQLTNIDLLEIPCSMEYIDKHEDGLCREMFCRMTTRGIDSKTSGQECESIGNILNSVVILKACEGSEDCERIFEKRK